MRDVFWVIPAIMAISLIVLEPVLTVEEEPSIEDLKARVDALEFLIMEREYLEEKEWTH